MMPKASDDTVQMAVVVKSVAVIEWEKTLSERIDRINEARNWHGLSDVGEVIRGILIEAFRTDRRTATVKLSFLGEDK